MASSQKPNSDRPLILRARSMSLKILTMNGGLNKHNIKNHILGHECDSLGMYGTEDTVLKQGDQKCLCSFLNIYPWLSEWNWSYFYLKAHDGGGLEPQVLGWAKRLSDFTNDAWKWHLEGLKASFLVFGILGRLHTHKHTHVYLWNEKIGISLISPNLHQSSGAWPIPPFTRGPWSANHSLTFRSFSSQWFPWCFSCQHFSGSLAPCRFTCSHLGLCHGSNLRTLDWAAWCNSPLIPFQGEGWENIQHSFNFRAKFVDPEKEKENLCSSSVECVRNPELMESSEDASSSPLAAGACFPRGIFYSGFFTSRLFFPLKIIEASLILVVVDIFGHHWVV